MNDVPETEMPVAEVYELRLYVAGQSPKSVTAFANLKRLCEERLPLPLRKIVGDLSNTERTLVGLQLRPAKQDD